MGRDDQGILRSRGRYEVIPRMLCFVTYGDEMLLLRGAPRKRLWAGLYNGVGGHVEPGEDVYLAALREIEEETGLRVHDTRLRGVIHVDVGDPILGVLIFVFTAVATDRQIAPSAEGDPEWLPMKDLPLAQMVEDLPILLPRVLAMGPTDPPFFAVYRYDDNDRLVVTFAGPV